MESNIGDFIDPEGWAPWNKTKPFVDTCYLAEYNNYGPGANLSRRITWPGYKGNISEADAKNFTAGEWLQAGTESSPILGTVWFKGLHVPHYLGFKH
jgi:pectinesterase